MAFTHRFRKFGGVSLAFVTLAAGLLGPGRAHGEEPSPAGPAWYQVLGATPAQRERAEGMARSYAEAEGLLLRGAGAASTEEPPALEVSEAGLGVLTQAELALSEAHSLNAELREPTALRVLAQAEATLLSALEVPGVHAFLAEVYVQLGLCAAQLGESGLFETAFSRALSLDPRRRLEAAEAPPALLERARELGRAQDMAASSELALLPEPTTARAWLDGAALPWGAGPTRVRAGVHVLVVVAPGHAAYATLLKLEPGRRAPVRVLLSPLPLEQARRALHASENVSQAAPLARRLAGLTAGEVLLFEPAEVHARVLIHRCDGAACRVVQGRQQGAEQPAQFAREDAAYAWLNAKAVTEEPRETRPFWKRWPLWTAAGLVVVGGVSAAIWATRPVPTRAERELTLDPTALPR